ncbi:aromatic acid exporter family protein [Staphylococcus epidermidis]|nr:aromatic acid exporter family protein [Staphylococcus epidermidis]MCC3708529.1 aromatic acid exporter family protein [Staphylococcus epidermidis]
MLKLNPYKIGFRTVKTAVGMTLGVIICKLLSLDNYASSAILVVLCIKHTKMHSVQAILSRLVSCLLILFLGSAIFSLLGQHAFVLGLIVLLFIPLTVVLNVQEGVITSCVILLHVFNAKAINGHLILNEIMLLIVGLGIAFLMNLMMPSLDKKLNHFKQDIENQITEIFNIFSQACSMHNDHLNIKFDSLLLNIKKAKSLAFRDVKNHFVRNENSFYHYFDMREEQVELLKRMTSLLERINTDDPILEKISQLMYEIGSNVNSNDYTALRLHSLYEIRLSLDDLPLPTTHKTLNSRAHIIQILNELEESLKFKFNFGPLNCISKIKKAVT